MDEQLYIDPTKGNLGSSLGRVSWLRPLWWTFSKFDRVGTMLSQGVSYTLKLMFKLTTCNYHFYDTHLETPIVNQM